MSNETEDWQRLGRLLIARRVNLGHPVRSKFVKAKGLTHGRTISDVENAKRTNFEPATRALIEQLYEWRPGSLNAVLAGGEPIPVHKASGSGGTAWTGAATGHAPESRPEWEATRLKRLANRAALAATDAQEALRQGHLDLVHDRLQVALENITAVVMLAHGVPDAIVDAATGAGTPTVIMGPPPERPVEPEEGDADVPPVTTVSAVAPTDEELERGASQLRGSDARE